MNISPSRKQKKKLEATIKKTPYATNLWGSGNKHEQTVCTFMQLMPKHTGRYHQIYQKEDNSWDVKPETYQDNIDDLTRIPLDVNSDIINPLAAIILQRRTIEYFSDPNVHDRIYSL